ncbi:MAG: hypothetical protein II077_06390, partial [Treponema sp.]|nr:hypothetical protein [Treponema sp.]
WYYLFSDGRYDLQYYSVDPGELPYVPEPDGRQHWLYRIENDGLIHFRASARIDEDDWEPSATIIEGVGFVQNNPFTKAIGSVTFTYRGDTPSTPSRTPVTESE